MYKIVKQKLVSKLKKKVNSDLNKKDNLSTNKEPDAKSEPSPSASKIIIEKSLIKKSDVKSEPPLSMSKKIIGNTIRFGNLEVAEYDFPNTMNWQNAKNACIKLGNGWRLPTKNELKTLYQNMDKIGGFEDYYYWSSTEDDSKYSWGQDFYPNRGKQSYYLKSDTYNVRAVRSL